MRVLSARRRPGRGVIKDWRVWVWYLTGHEFMLYIRLRSGDEG